MGVAPCPWHAQKGKVPPFGRTFPGLAIPRQELAASSSLLSLLPALTVRILLLAGLVAGTLLLTRLLARILDSADPGFGSGWSLELVEPCLSRTRSETTQKPSGCFLEKPAYRSLRRDRELTAKTPLHKPLKPHLALLPHPVPAVRKNETTLRLRLPWPARRLFS